MVETRKVKLMNIVYDGRTTYLSVCGAAQLQQFARGLGMNCYDSESAPKEYLVEITTDFEQIDHVIDEAQRVAEDELGLTIKTFRLIY